MQQWEAAQLEKAGIQIEPHKNKNEPNSAIESSLCTDRGVESITNVDDLPVTRHRQPIIDLIKQHSVVVVCGETGSGKSTQLPLFLRESGIVNGTSHKLIVTQPRRLAAVALATRVAQEMQCELGKEVGYSVRFESRLSAEKTEIKFSTEGMMLRELLANPTLQGYSAAMIDEAHERTLEADVIFGLLRSLLKQRPDFRIIISSATLDAEKFAKYFQEDNTSFAASNAAIYRVEGRLFPVEKFFLPSPCGPDFVEACIDTIAQIHLSKENDDMAGILAFLPGQADIERAAAQLRTLVESWGVGVPELSIICVYSNMSVEAQTRVFKPPTAGQRKVVLATNIAETSLTIPNIGYVVDTGLVKHRQYEAKAGMDTLVMGHCSRASAEQRAGRAGRTSAGKCYRLYTKQQFHNDDIFEPQSKPEILRSNLSQVCLLLLSLGISDPLIFPWIDCPSSDAVVQALKLLYVLGAVTSEAMLTKLGRIFAEFPSDPRWARALLSYGSTRSITNRSGSSDNNMSPVVMAAAMMGELGSVFVHPKSQNPEILATYARFNSQHGDFHTLINIFKEWSLSNYSHRWCRENFMDFRSLRRAKDVANQLVPLTARMHSLLEDQNFKIRPEGSTGDFTQAIANGFFTNAARLSLDGRHYVGFTSNQPLYIHPSSSLWSQNPPPKVIIYHELMCTTKEYMRGCLAVDEAILKELQTVA